MARRDFSSSLGQWSFFFAQPPNAFLRIPFISFLVGFRDRTLARSDKRGPDASFCTFIHHPEPRLSQKWDQMAINFECTSNAQPKYKTRPPPGFVLGPKFHGRGGGFIFDREKIMNILRGNQIYPEKNRQYNMKTPRIYNESFFGFEDLYKIIKFKLFQQFSDPNFPVFHYVSLLSGSALGSIIVWQNF